MVAGNYIYFINTGDFESDFREKNIRAFLEKICVNHPEHLNENIMVTGDYLTKLGFEMKYREFMRIKIYFFDLPQDTYVWFPETKKCINFTFEDELYYG